MTPVPHLTKKAVIETRDCKSRVNVKLWGYGVDWCWQECVPETAKPSVPEKEKRKRVRDSEGGVCGWSRAELVCYQRTGAVPSPAT